MDLLPEFLILYGNEVTLSLDIKLDVLGDNAITLSTTEGILIGANNQLQVTLTVYASNETLTDDLACEF